VLAHVSEVQNAILRRYSMNGVYKSAFMTIHVTPESGFSYASCELHGFCPRRLNPSTMASAISAIFKPRRFVVTCSTSSPLPDGACAWALSSLPVPGYVCESASSHTLSTGGFVRFYTLAAADSAREVCSLRSACGSTQSLVDVG
jgi:S-adenosylmethionine decarboxylase